MAIRKKKSTHNKYKRIQAAITLFLIATAVFLVASWFIKFSPVEEIFFRNQQEGRGFNYKFAYFKDNDLYIYDLGDNIEQRLAKDVGSTVDLVWSSKGQLLFKNQSHHLLLADLVTSETQLLRYGVTGKFFWDREGVKIYFEELYKDGKLNYAPAINGIQADYDLRKTFIYDLNGGEKEIDPAEYDRAQNDLINTNINKASTDGRFFSFTDYTHKDAKVYLEDTKMKKAYMLPVGSGKPLVSLNNGYLAVKDNRGTQEKEVFYIYKMSEVYKERFSNYIFSRDDIYDYSWLGNERLLYITSKYTGESGFSAYEYAVYIYDLRKKDTKTMIKPFKTSAGFMDAYTSPDGKRLVYRDPHEEGNTPETFKAWFDLSVFDTETGQKLKTIPYDYGQWSGPL